MGRKITELALKDSAFAVTALVENAGRPDLQKEFFGIPVSTDINAIKGADVAIDFTLADAATGNLEACVRHGVRHVIGTTGLSAEQAARFDTAAARIAIVRSTNMSIGVNVVFGLLRQSAQLLKGYRVSVTETHHVHKKDAPSGTAKTMAEVVEKASGVKVEDVASVREGEVIGYHKVTFDSAVDTVEIVHNAKTREMFAEGALTAAKFIAGKSSGQFNMQQVLGLV
jgi:4-hydroxy-tetrahydrodipicolinate reductase